MAAGVGSDDRLFIVGIGASAGGLQALQTFFRGLPADPGMAFVVVTHQARGHESALPTILARYTALAVESPTEGTAVRPNHVYVCPPDCMLSIKEGRLHMDPISAERARFPIDAFLFSLAEDAGESAVGILLSGGGTDGTLGIKAIKDRGGLTMAQGRDASGPLQSGMPDTAIAAGVVDVVLTAETMGKRLVDYAHTFTSGEPAAVPEEKAATNDHEEICRILLNRTGHDFSGYKLKTFRRRVQRRMQVLRLVRLDQYIERLRDDPDEASLLFRDLLISVTSFLRDPAAFEALQRLVIPRMFAGKGANDGVRVWVPGCATGEEVYSIAMLMREYMDSVRSPPKIQIFATDIDEGALAIARLGQYAGSSVEHVSAARLKRFFTEDDAGFTVSKDIREMCVFSAHNMLRDPPFSKLDLISCRNVLIYLGAEMQDQVIPTFHFALKPSAFLFLGTAENVSHNTDLFSPLDKKQRIFQRRDHVAAAPGFSRLSARGWFAGGPATVRHEPLTTTADLGRLADARIVEHFAPAYVVVNRDGDILHYSPHTGKYLEPAAGVPNRQLLAMTRKGLRLELHSALHEVVEKRRPVERERIPVESDNHTQIVNLTVEPIGENDSDPLFLVVFRDAGEPVTPADVDVVRTAPVDAPVERLEQKLRESRDRLQSTIEEYEIALQELKASNEELQSINEELQSTNEELETSKEELQSVNEELQTVNTELNDKIEQLDAANADLRNIFESTQLATVFLDRNLVIRTFTPAITAIFNLISTDRGRPLTDIVSHIIDIGQLGNDIRTVFERGQIIERRVQHTDLHKHYLMRILPYRGHNSVVEGALVTFVDVTNLVEAEARQGALQQELGQRAGSLVSEGSTSDSPSRS
ncbi:MAG: CheR family methyltransferase [Candidatus Binataceae bacterium]